MNPGDVMWGAPLLALIGWVYYALAGRIRDVERSKTNSATMDARLDERLRAIERELREVKDEVRALRGGEKLR